MHHLYATIFIICFGIFTTVSAQSGIVYGRVMDRDNFPIELVTIAVADLQVGTTSNSMGRYEIELPAEKNLVLTISRVGYETKKITIILSPNQRKRLDIVLNDDVRSLEEVRVVEEPLRHTTTQYINPRVLKQMPGISDPISLVVKSLPGVSANNEMSNQYSVRGGNYDENLIYVNGTEIYKPFLVRSGQQEGMTFINSDMIKSLSFSAGGFEAKYGDKMSSVLDVEYRRPTSFQSKIDFGLLGGSVLTEGVSANTRFSYIAGLRYKQTRNILGTLDVKGDYQPSFLDYQMYLTYDLSENTELSFIGYVSDNQYKFKPTIRETTFGLVNNVLRFKVYFEGQEIDRFTTIQAISSLRHKFSDSHQLRLSASTFYSREHETFDILGQYWLNQIDTDLGSSTLGDSIGSLAVGTYLDHARNYVNAWVTTFSLKGEHKQPNHYLQWGITGRFDRIENENNEWRMLDSAGYSVPYYSFYDTVVDLFYTRRFANHLNTARLSSFVQDTWNFAVDSTQLFLTAGLRFHFMDFTKEAILSPRILLAIRPNWRRDWLFRVSTGVFYQPSFYKEMVLYGGALNRGIKSQKSVHYVVGADYNFQQWRRPFKLVLEAYYKSLSNLVPYLVDNVRIIYDGYNHANGYVYGADCKLTGEFVKGVDSWISVSYLRTYEDLTDDFYIINRDNKIDTIYPGYIPRPTDQRFLFSMFFQDYWRGNPTIKFHLNAVFNTGLPVGPPNSPPYMRVFRMPVYSRVDMGVSKEITRRQDKMKILGFFENIWLGFEIFNVFDIENVISYTWITDVRNRQFAIPNTLTGRLYNIKVNLVF